MDNTLRNNISISLSNENINNIGIFYFIYINY